MGFRVMLLDQVKRAADLSRELRILMAMASIWGVVVVRRSSGLAVAMIAAFAMAACGANTDQQAVAPVAKCPTNFEPSTPSLKVKTSLPHAKPSGRPGAAAKVVPEVDAVSGALSCAYGNVEQTAPQTPQAYSAEGARELANQLNENTANFSSRTTQSNDGGWFTVTVFTYATGPNVQVVRSPKGLTSNGQYSGWDFQTPLVPSPVTFSTPPKSESTIS